MHWGEVNTDQNNVIIQAQSSVFSGLINSGYFVRDQLGTVLPAFVLFIPFYKQIKTKIISAHFEQRFLIILTFFPILFTVALSVLSGSFLVTRWSFPFFSTLGIFLLAWFNPVITKKSFTLFISLIMVLTSILIFGNIYIFKIKPFLSDPSVASRFAIFTAFT